MHFLSDRNKEQGKIKESIHIFKLPFFLYFCFCFLFLAGMNSSAQLPDGNWHAAIKLNDTLELPFTFTSAENKIIIHNGDDNILIDEINFSGDSIIIQMPVFDSQFRCRISVKNLTGRFYNYARK